MKNQIHDMSKSERLKDRRARRKILWGKRDELQKRLVATTDETLRADLEHEIEVMESWIKTFDAKIKEDASE